MPRWLFRLVVLIVLVHDRSAGARKTIRFVPDFAHPAQTMDGFGVTWGGDMFAGIHPEAARLLFEDLGLSIVRIQMPWTHEVENDNDSPYVIDWDGFDFQQKATRIQLWVCQQAKRYGVQQFSLCPWTNPLWMKTNGRRTGGRLKKECYEEFGEYLAAFVLWMKREHGIAVTHLSVQNEPNARVPWQSTEYAPEELVALVAAVGRVFDHYRLRDVRFLYPDTGGIARASLRYAQALMDHGEARERVRIYAYHGYKQFMHPEAFVPSMIRVREVLGDKFRIWMSEMSNMNSERNGDGMANTWDEALATAIHIHNHLVLGHCSQWSWWTGLSEFRKGRDKRGQALLTASSLRSDAPLLVSPKFHVVKHFAKFIRPGYARIPLVMEDDDGKDARVLASMFVDEHGERPVLVLINPSREPMEVDVRHERLPAAMDVYRSRRDDYYRRLAPVRIALHAIHVVLPPESVTTVVATHAH